MCLLVKSKLSPMLAWQELLLEHHIEAFTWDNLTTLNNLKDAGPLLALLLSCDTPLHFFLLLHWAARCFQLVVLTYLELLYRECKEWECFESSQMIGKSIFVRKKLQVCQ